MDITADSQRQAFREDVLRTARALDMHVSQLVHDLERERHSNVSDGLWNYLALIHTSANDIAYLIQPMLEQLTTVAEQLSELTELTANPEATKSDEFLRRAAKAFQNGWLSEAEKDARRAIKRDPYHYHSYHLLARVLSQTGRISESARAFAKTARYSAPYDQLLSARATLIGMHAYRSLGDIGRSIELGRATSSVIKIKCPEIMISVARLSGNSDEAAEALLLDPDLLPVAIAIGIPHVEGICERIAGTMQKRLEHLIGVAELAKDRIFMPVERLLRAEIARRPLPLQERCVRCQRTWSSTGAWPECRRKHPSLVMDYAQIWEKYSNRFESAAIDLNGPEFSRRLSVARDAVSDPSASSEHRVAVLARHESELYKTVATVCSIWAYLRSDSATWSHVREAMASIKEATDACWLQLSSAARPILRTSRDKCGLYI